MAPMAPEIAAATSAPVEAITREVNVEAFMPCSAAETKYASTARMWMGSGSPCQRIIMRSTTVRPLSISCVGTIGTPTPRAACAAKDMAMTETRARSSRAWSSSMSSNGWSPQAGASMAIADCMSTRTLPECTGIG